MTVAFSTGERATLPPDYLDAGYLTHAYASTVHKAQGMTCDRAFLLATDDLYQELGYVALSRGRLGNHIVTVGELEHDLESPPHAPTVERDSLDDLRSGLSTSRAQQLAIDLDRAALRQGLAHYVATLLTSTYPAYPQHPTTPTIMS